MGSYFSTNYSKIKYSKADDKTNGLRNPQLGAIHSISSFFTLNKSKAKVKSIQDTLHEVLIENSELDYIIYDHSTREMADFITIQAKN